WHSTAMYTDLARPLGLEHSLLACLPSALPRTAGPGRYVQLALCRGPGPDFSERDRAVLTLLAPHLDQAYLDAERRRHPVPPLPPKPPAALGARRAHQHPARPAAGYRRGDRAHPPGKLLPTAGGLEPRRRRPPRLPRPGRVGAHRVGRVPSPPGQVPGPAG